MSAAYQKMKTGAGNVAGTVKSGAGQAASGAKSCIFDLTVYAGTILIALAYAELAQNVFLIMLDKKDPEDIPLWLLWIYAAVTISMSFLTVKKYLLDTTLKLKTQTTVLAMIICFFTGQTISFGEDAC